MIEWAALSMSKHGALHLLLWTAICQAPRFRDVAPLYAVLVSPPLLSDCARRLPGALELEWQLRATSYPYRPRGAGTVSFVRAERTDSAREGDVPI